MGENVITLTRNEKKICDLSFLICKTLCFQRLILFVRVVDVDMAVAMAVCVYKRLTKPEESFKSPGAVHTGCHKVFIVGSGKKVWVPC